MVFEEFLELVLALSVFCTIDTTDVVDRPAARGDSQSVDVQCLAAAAPLITFRVGDASSFQHLPLKRATDGRLK